MNLDLQNAPSILLKPEGSFEYNKRSLFRRGGIAQFGRALAF